jgi:hypothetical protein
LIHHLIQSLSIDQLKIFFHSDLLNFLDYYQILENFLLMINQYYFLNNIVKENRWYLINQNHYYYHLNDNLNKDLSKEIEFLDILDLQFDHHVNVD